MSSGQSFAPNFLPFAQQNHLSEAALWRECSVRKSCRTQKAGKTPPGIFPALPVPQNLPDKCGDSGFRLLRSRIGSRRIGCLERRRLGSGFLGSLDRDFLVAVHAGSGRNQATDDDILLQSGY